MSDSRLEKFIYAICSMNVSDLPVPLSRIEKLWNCLITEEAPDFEPLSRNEKYLMAMLDRYDISNLPAPMSRGEKLLYKIAVGETDLSDVSGYLSRYEELLKYLIENGGISGGDFEYVLYTLNQSLYTLYTTAEKPVKTAILKGNTLVNIVNYSETFVNTSGKYLQISSLVYSPIGKQITLINFSDKMITFQVTENGAFKKTVSINANSKTVITLSDGEEIKNIRGSQSNGWEINETSLNELKLGIMVIDGDYTNVDIPYFTGMQSVKMPVLTTTGKNLFDMSEIVMSDFEQNKYQSVYYGKEIQLQPNTTYTIKPYLISEITNTNVWTVFNLIVNSVKTEVVNANYTGSGTDKKAWNTQTFETDETGVVGYSIYCHKNNEESWFGNLPIEVQLEEGSTATPYEPFKSNILSTSEDVVLRGIGDVQDKLDCLTGEVTESIGEIVLDGSQNMDADGRGIYIQVDDMKKVEDYRTIITCDKLPVFYHQWDLPNVENGITGYLDEENKYPGQNWLYIKVNNNIDVNEVRQILTQNPITAQYELSVESIKTVDLTTVDQDNQPTELGTFENVTHVSLVAENLIPEVEMEVATRISTELASASPLMDDISTKQEQLNTTVDEQSNNIDATMIATTEIYEETL